MITRKFFLFLASITFFFILSFKSVNADSNYVFPYPSSMPGSMLYKIHLVSEKIMQYWYFGSFGQFNYNLKQADRYLVESKTLFEYKQYLLAYKSLEKSNSYFAKTPIFLDKAFKEGKNITQKEILFKNATLKHIEVLLKLKNDLPKKFVWAPEKSPPTVLNIEKLLNESIALRSKDL